MMLNNIFFLYFNSYVTFEVGRSKKDSERGLLIYPNQLIGHISVYFHKKIICELRCKR